MAPAMKKRFSESEFSPEAKKQLEEMRAEIDTLRDARTKLSRLEYKCHSLIDQEQKRLQENLKTRKSQNSNRYMNLVFYWDNGKKFDTRGYRYANDYSYKKRAANWTEFKDMVFQYGLPKDVEVRG